MARRSLGTETKTVEDQMVWGRHRALLKVTVTKLVLLESRMGKKLRTAKMRPVE